MDKLRLWAFGDSHVGTDIRRGRESMADAIRDSESAFEWELAINVGDYSGGQSVPEDAEGEELVRQLGTLQEHPREAIYDISGNHDRSGLTEPPACWWRKWVDPMGQHTAFSGVDNERRPYPVSGTWERYSFRVGNLLFLMMSDINEPTQTIGRGDLGGNPSGVVTGETFRWWREQVEANPDCIILSAHHYMLKETTVASGEWEGMERTEEGGWRDGYHGYKPQGTPRGASYLYWVDSVQDAMTFERWLEAHPGSVDLWFGGHTHTHPDDTFGGKSHIETGWGGTHFLNVSALTRYHGKTAIAPMSRHLTFTPGSDEVEVRCFMHTDDYRPKGWYEEKTCRLPLRHAFQP